MTSKKQAKAYEAKRHEQHQRKIEQAQARQRRRARVAGIVVGAVALGALLVVIFLALTSDDDATTAGAGDQTAATPTPTASASASASATPDVTQPDATQPDATAPEVDTSGWANSLTAPGPELALNKLWTVTLDTNQGPLTLELDGKSAPQAVASFVSLAQEDFFDHTDCHRLTTAGIFVLQCGDPTGTGTGGPGYRFGPLENTPDDDFYPAGTLAMARVGNDPESMGSQFFIVYKDSVIPSDAAGGYTVFGQVTDGLAIVEDVAQAGTIIGGTDGRPAVSVIINEVSVS